MAEYIDKQAAIADLNETYDKMAGCHPQIYNGYQFAVNRLRVYPAAEVEPVRHGRWINKQEDDLTEGMWRCSACGEDFYFLENNPSEYGINYCVNCGARMDGRQ